MERLYAPWRLSYVKGEKKSDIAAATSAATGCIFCDKPAQENDAANYIVWRGPTCYALLNAYPYNNGHLMVVPYRHASRPTELMDEENGDLMVAAAHLTRVLDSVYRPDGYNIGMNVGGAAGAGIAAHLHLHIVPRWGGDTNFMPVIADTKVLPERLAQTYESIVRAMAEAGINSTFNCEEGEKRP